MALVSVQDVLSFWFDELTPQQWFNTFAKVDEAIATRFAQTHDAASRGELFDWRETPDGRLAEIIVLDQFSRNLFRNDPRSFATDTLALVLAQEAIAAGDDQRINPDRLAFLYMPFMHAEDMAMQDECVRLVDSRLEDESTLFHAKAHRKLIEKFGRFPHRNKTLGRESTAAEIDFLKKGGYAP